MRMRGCGPCIGFFPEWQETVGELADRLGEENFMAPDFERGSGDPEDEEVIRSTVYQPLGSRKLTKGIKSFPTVLIGNADGSCREIRRDQIVAEVEREMANRRNGSSSSRRDY